MQRRFNQKSGGKVTQDYGGIRIPMILKQENFAFFISVCFLFIYLFGFVAGFLKLY